MNLWISWPRTGIIDAMRPHMDRPMTDRPLAVKGLVSYRYRGPFGWIMIGAKDDSDALNEARRSLEEPDKAEKKSLHRWIVEEDDSRPLCDNCQD